MTRDQALRQAQKRWKKVAAIRVEGEASSPERRAAAKERRDKLNARRAEIDAEILRLEIAAGIPELRAEREQVVKASLVAFGEALHRRFLVGYVDDRIGMFHMQGHGDTWEEAFAAYDAKGEKGWDK